MIRRFWCFAFIVWGTIIVITFLPMRLRSLHQEFKYLVIQSLAKKDPPLRYYSLYKVKNPSGSIYFIHSTKSDWPRDLPQGTIVEKRKGEVAIRINGRPAMTKTEDTLLRLLPIWLGCIMVATGAILLLTSVSRGNFHSR